MLVELEDKSQVTIPKSVVNELGLKRGMVDEKLRTLSRNPWHPSLRTKRIRRTSEYEVSVNMDIRIDIAFEGSKLIIMPDIDHHGKLLKRRSNR